MEDKKAMCPKCGKQWLWNWEMDWYEDTYGKVCVQTTLHNPSAKEDNTDSIETYSCHCGQVLGAVHVNDDGADIWNITEWAMVDFQDDFNSAKQ